MDGVERAGPVAESTARILMLPYGGGGASAYRALAAELPAAIEGCPLQPPGREERVSEEPIAELDALVDEVVLVARSLGPEPLALYGHSLGALVGYHAALRLEAEGRSIRSLFVGAFTAPQRPNTWLFENLPRLHRAGFSHVPSPRAPNAGKVAQLLLGGEEALAIARDSPQLLDRVVPVLLADFRIVDRYRHPAHTPKLRCPIVAFGGEADARVPAEDLAAWAELGAGGFTRHDVPGDHFFLRDAGARARLVEAMLGAFPEVACS